MQEINDIFLKEYIPGFLKIFAILAIITIIYILYKRKK